MDIDKLVNRLRPLAEKIEKLSGDGDYCGYWMVTFPATGDADYRFVAYVYEDGEAGLSARRIGADDDEYFWGYTMEAVGFDDPEDIGKILLDDVSRLLAHDTRIIQSVGLINVGFDCEYADDEGWHSIPGHAALRFSNFKFPKIDGKEKVYKAPAVRPGGKAR